MPLDWGSIGQAAFGVAIIIAGLFSGWQGWRASRKADRAAKNAYPVSNGWGTKVARDLSYLRESVDRMHSRMDASDARQTAADQRAAGIDARVAEAADHARTAAEQSSTVAAGLASRLADHAAGSAANVHLEVVKK